VNPIVWDLGDGVVVRTFTLDDDAELFAVIDANRDRLRPWMIWEPATKEVADTRAWIESCLASEFDMEGNGIYVDGALAGGIGLSIDPIGNSASIGYWLGDTHEGRGIVTRSCVRFFDFAFDELRLHRMSLTAAVDNVRSRAVALRLGMREEGVHRDAGRVPDGYLDLAWYGILEEEWRARRGSLGG
jgi:ribosomal-protein-serine acetyltransferase